MPRIKMLNISKLMHSTQFILISFLLKPNYKKENLT